MKLTLLAIVPALLAAASLGDRLVEAASTPAECAALVHRGRRTEATACYQSLTLSADHYVRAEGYWGLELYEDAKHEFEAALSAADRNATYRVRFGRLMHERFNNQEAVNLFNEALQRDPKDADAYVGLALVGADGFERKARESAAKAIELNPSLIEAHELMAGLALEDSNEADAIMEADTALKIAPDALDALALHAAIELVADRPADSWIQKMLAVNPVYGKGYALIAYHLVMNRRYDDGVTYYRKAIELDPRLWSARAQLAVNLMRLGQEDEPRKQLEMCYQNGYRDPATVNSLRLLDSYKNFVISKDATTALKLDKKEAELLRPYFDDMLKRAVAAYSKKYRMTLPGPVQVEAYPNKDDFAVRTIGMPGLGALGVTFGAVVAMDSPSSGKPGEFNWASTMWHEMDHVFVLTATRHRVPRWFAEGLAVHEEGEANPHWANRMTPEVVVAMKDKKLLPVADLDRGFIHPEYPEQVVVSYFQAGRICDYIQQQWGADKLVEMVHAFEQVRPTADVIRQLLGLPPEQFDQQFQAWLYKQAGPIVTSFDEWRAHLKNMVEASAKKQVDVVVTEGEAARRLYPEYVGEASPYAFLADIHQAQGDKAGALAILADYQKVGGEDPATLKKLAALREEMGQIKEAAATLDEINNIYPEDEELHRHLGELWLKENNYSGAIREYSAVVALNSLDKAGTFYNLAQALFAAKRIDEAEQAVLKALEAAPSYRPAQQLLLKIEDASAPRRPQ
jgi:tetratricopeptide (TPR) repeat protein